MAWQDANNADRARLLAAAEEAGLPVRRGTTGAITNAAALVNELAEVVVEFQPGTYLASLVRGVAARDAAKDALLRRAAEEGLVPVFSEGPDDKRRLLNGQRLAHVLGYEEGILGALAGHHALRLEFLEKARDAGYDVFFDGGDRLRGAQFAAVAMLADTLEVGAAAAGGGGDDGACVGGVGGKRPRAVDPLGAGAVRRLLAPTAYEKELVAAQARADAKHAEQHAEHVAYMQSKGVEGVLGDEDLGIIMRALLDEPRTELGGASLRSVLESPQGRTYLGSTFRQLEAEAWGFLTKRGVEQQKVNGTWTRTGARALPAITYASGGCISPGDAASKLGFVALFVYRSTVKANVYRMESLLQKMFHHLCLGNRLWRVVGAGPKFASAEEAAERKVLYKVYFTCSKGFDFADNDVVVNMRSTTAV